MGIDQDYNVIKTIQISEKYIRPKIPNSGHAGLDTMAGFSLFHSSYMPILLQAARRNNLDPYFLMNSIGSNDVTPELIEETTNGLQMPNYLKSEFKDRYYGNEQ
jgi:hypothetical protein